MSQVLLPVLVVIIGALKKIALVNNLNVVNKDKPGDDTELYLDEDLSLMSKEQLPVLGCLD